MKDEECVTVHLYRIKYQEDGQIPAKYANEEEMYRQSLQQLHRTCDSPILCLSEHHTFSV
jgi:hypothetical protein